MHSVISLKLFTHLFLYFSLVNALELFFYNDIADTPQETIEFESGSLFYTGVLPHIKSFTCTADNINTETVTWYDTSGNEVPMGTGASSTLYWTGVGGNKTLHTSNNAGTDFISVANQGNNFTCRVNGTAQVKYFGIYWVRPILSNANTIQTDLRGFRIYTKNTPPVISEFTLQRGLFNFDFNKLYKVQSMKGSSNITFRPDMVTYSASSIPSIIDNVTFSNTSVCQSIGTSDSDELYTTISDRAFFNYEPGNFANPRLSNSLCIENGTIGPSVLTIGNTSPDIRYTCPLVYNGEFIDIEDFSIDTVNSNVTTVNASLNLNENRRRLWIDFTASNPITLIYDREYICEDMYGTRLSFRLIVNGNNPLEVFDSNFATFGVTNSTNYISNSIPNTLYCLSMSSTLEVTWYFDNIANRSQFISSAQVTSNSSYLPYIDTPRTGRSDLFLNETIRSETEGYYTCSDNINEVRIGVFLQELVAPVVNASSLSIPIDTPINITCGVSNFPYPPALYYWTGRNPSSTSLLDTTGFTEADSGFYTCHATNVVGADEMTINISIIPAPPVLVASNLTVMDFYFEEDPFQLSCTFSTNPNPLSPLLISWYKDNMLIMDGSNGVQIQTMSTETNTNHSVLSVASAVPANAGQYSCRALIGASNPAMSGIANVVVEASYQPDVVSIELGRIGSVSAELSWNGTNRNRTAPETYVVSYCELPKCNSYTQSPSLVTTSYHLTGLRSLSNYSVFVIATNRYGSTDGANKNLSTLLERVLLFKGSRRYMGSNEDVYFASGSIFRGVNIDVGFPIRQFFCTYDPSTDTIEWYTPNGDLIPLNGPSSSFYHTINSGESTLHIGNHVSAENEGRNFTCRINSSGFIQDHFFGLYYMLTDLVTTTNYVGERIYSTSVPPLVRELTLQRGTFDFDYDMLYEIQSLQADLADYNWKFNPPLEQPQVVNDSLRLLTAVKFSNSSICQIGTSQYQPYFFSISNKPFILKTTPRDGIAGLLYLQASCIENNSTAYVYRIGEGVDIGVTCPLFFNATFLDTSDIIQLNYTINRNNPRRFFVDPSKTLAMVKHDREYICEDKYGTRASFKARVDANAPIQVFDTDSTITPTNNDTMYFVTEVTLYCLSDSVSNGVVWYSDTNPNSTLPRTYTPVSDNVTAQPYVSNPRNGRSDLVVRPDQSSYQEGYFYCQDSMNRVMFYSIFTQQPIVPSAQIIPNVSTLQLVIGASSPLTCGHTNSPHPSAISYWTGTMTSIIYTSQLLESDSRIYTCTSSNVFGYTSASISIIVIPPPPQNIDLLQPINSTNIFVTDIFQLSCQFETFSNVSSSFLIQWYHNNDLNILFPNTININENIATSTLTVTNSSFQQAGDYHCVATVGGSSPTNSTNISVSINPITLPNPINVTITDSELRNVNVSWTLSIQFPSLTETYTLVYQRVGDSSYQTTNTLNSTSFTLTGLLFNSQYKVYINATNRFGTTQGSDNTFSTEQVRLYFMRDGEIVQFASGSIFRGGTHSIVSGGVFQFYCVPDSPDQEITWYAPNGDIIPAGPLIPSLYHIRDVNTGESVLYTNDRIAPNTEGLNYTCSIDLQNGQSSESYFGIYYVWLVLSFHDIFGVRLYGPGNLIYEFVYQIGTFDLDFSYKYDIECLDPSNQLNQWEFEPNLLSESSRTNTLITQAQFNPNATCQSISCKPSVQYPVFSNKPFFLQTNLTIGQPNCRPNNYAYEFNLGSPIELYITCPLIFGARFLNINGIEVIENDFTVDTSRRLFFNSTANIATLAYDRDYICEDRYGARVTFFINVLANEVIQLFGNEDSNNPILNGTNLIGANITNSISCIIQASGNSVNWFVNSNPNRSLNEAPMQVNTNSATFPYTTNPRVGRSNLILNGTIGSGNEGFYSCVTNPSITVGIFAQTPVVPTATISPDQTMVQVVIGTNIPVLNCQHSNSPHPPPIYFWTGSINSSTAILDTNLLLESDSGVYTCTASNVLGMSIDTVTITVIPPPPQFDMIQISPQPKIYINDDVILQCQFSTFQNITSELVVEWYKDGINISNTANIILTIIGNTIAISTLTLSNSQVEEEGDYYCQARVGDSQLSVSNIQTLNVDPPPNPIYVKLISIPESPYLTQDTQLQCQFSTLPRFQAMLMIDWYHNSTIMLNNMIGIQITRITVNESIVESTLTLEKIAFIQAGDYHCVGKITGSEQIMSNIYTLKILSPTSQPTTQPSSFNIVPVIIGIFIGILIIIILIFIIILVGKILMVIGSRRTKYSNENLSNDSAKRYRKNRLRSTHSDKQLVTPTSSLGLNMEINYTQDKQYHNEAFEGATTFTKSGSFQETMLTNVNVEGATGDPLYEDFTFENYSIPIEIFPDKVLDYHLANNAEFERQYSTIRKTFIHDVSTGSHIYNKPKNRFANIIPYEHSRVKMSFTGEHNSDYINACYLDGYYNRQAYIASQGPLPNTLNDFWRMIWEKNIEHIVALTKVMEAAKKKCEQYWPENEKDMCEFDMIQVTLKKCERYTSYDIRIMEVTHAEYPTDVRILIQFHYTVWPDHGVPIFSSSLISFINHTKEYHLPKKTQPPMLVHCSAGVGRTGTFIVLDYFLEHLKENDKVNIYRLVAQLRESRCLMVQTKDQYIFIHDALLDVICCKDTFIADHEFQDYLDNATIRSLESMSTPFEDQYELIMKTSRIVDGRDVAKASLPTNAMKNRFVNFVPFDSHRVTVIPDQDGEEDYINASFVHSYQKHKGFIAAQGPLQHTIYDFWKLITKYRIEIIIMLSDISEDGYEMSAKYWPEYGEEMLVQFLVIRCEKEEEFDTYIKRKFVVSFKEGGLNQSIQQIQFKKWPYNEQPDVDDLMVLYHQFTEMQLANKSKEISPILVHCDNGSTRTGTFIACVNAMQQIELERKVDIFQIVRNLRNSRPSMVPSLDLYILCFKLVACYIQSYEDKAYANFM